MTFPVEIIEAVIRNDLHAPIPVPSSLIAAHVAAALEEARRIETVTSEARLAKVRDVIARNPMSPMTNSYDYRIGQLHAFDEVRAALGWQPSVSEEGR